MKIDNIPGQVESTTKLLRLVEPFTHSRSPYAFLLISTLLFITGVVQLYYVGGLSKSSSMGEQSAFLAIGVVLFVIFQTSFLSKLLEFITKYPGIWLIAAILISFASSISAPIKGAARYIYIFGISFNTTPAVAICAVLFFVSIGENIKSLQNKEASFYLIAASLLLLLSMSERNLMQVKVVLLVSLSYFSLYGMQRRAIELFCLMVVLIGIGIAIDNNGYRSTRLFSFLNPENDPLGAGFQVAQSVKAWSEAELFRFGLRGPISINVPDIENAMAFSATVQLWGKIGVLIIVALMTAQFVIYNNGVVHCADKKTSLLGFGLFVVYYQSILSGFLSSVGLHPPSTQVAGAGFFSFGGGALFSFIVVSLGYNILQNQKVSTSIILLEEKKNNELEFSNKTYNRIIMTLFVICSLAYMYR